MCFFFNDTATTEIYTLSLHDALPISDGGHAERDRDRPGDHGRHALRVLLHDVLLVGGARDCMMMRSEEHTSELQSRQYLVCRLLLEKKKPKSCTHTASYSLPHTAMLF